ncbi:ATP-binding protein [Paenibacillus sp. MER 99-2]|nr:ATP-binding protein [Paenibacillus sp. MER 99-2]MCM3173666.1 ATP-binding protein [Paenibacillus sp. MER 99-2]
MQNAKLYKQNIVKNTIIILTTFALLFGMRWYWSYQMFPVLHNYTPINGVLDLRDINLDNEPLTSLSGEWSFYPDQLLTLSEIESGSYNMTPLQVPADWSTAWGDSSQNSYGYGTYHLQILINPIDQPVAFWFKELQASFEVEVNGEKLGGQGKVAKSAEEYEPYKISSSPSYTARNITKIDLVLRIANFDSPYDGGILLPAYFGSQNALDYSRWYSIGFQIFIFLVLMLHGAYAGILYLINSRERALLYAMFLVISVSVAILCNRDNIIALWLPINYTWLLKIQLVALLSQSILIILLFQSFLSRSASGLWTRIYIAMLLIAIVTILAVPVSYVYEIIEYFVFDGLYYAAFLWFITIAIKMVSRQKNDRDIIFLLISAACIVTNLLWSFAETSYDITTVYYPFDLIMALTGFSTYWFQKYFRNVSLNVKLNEELLKADQLKDQFLANTSHELRTPLNGIMNIAHHIVSKEKDRLSADSVQDMNLLITISRRMSHLIGDLLDVVQLKEHQITLQTEPLKLQSVVPGVVAMMKFMIESKAITLHNNIPDSLPMVMADEKRLVQIIYNLVHNAIKFTDGGTVTLSAEVRERKVFIHVSDTGIGMDKETLSRIFIQYEQGAAGVINEQGIGLGLSICQKLVELHGGSLDVLSEPSIGSTFTFSLQLADMGANVKLPEAPLNNQQDGGQELELLPDEELSLASKHHLETNLLGELNKSVWETSSTAGISPLLKESPVHILVVDDDPINLKVLVSILSSESYTVTTTNSGREALELLGTRQWDLLVSDVMMPQMSGYELTQKVRERYSVSELPILLLTARSQPSDIYTGFLSGANDYVTKPVDALELKYRIKVLTDLKQSINERLRIEAAYLQAQIHPHFLFNSLNSLIVLSMVDIDKMFEFGAALTSFLQISFNYLNTGEKVELHHELELVKSYLYIEQERFGERLSVIWNIDLDLKVMLPPLSIQPLVENAVRHGLLSRVAGGTLTLNITLQEQRKEVLIEVHDNGIGMEPQTVTQLLNDSMQDKRGIGIINTNRRLMQLYNKGLSIRSKLGEGTSVSFVIPYDDQSHT